MNVVVELFQTDQILLAVLYEVIPKFQWNREVNYVSLSR